MNRILVIDDDKELCALIQRCILTENIEADCCGSGREGAGKVKGKGISACRAGCDAAGHGRF